MYIYIYIHTYVSSPAANAAQACVHEFCGPLPCPIRRRTSQLHAGMSLLPGMLVKSYHFGLVVPPVCFHKIWPPSGARGMTFAKCFDWAKENSGRMSRALIMFGMVCAARHADFCEGALRKRGSCTLSKRALIKRDFCDPWSSIRYVLRRTVLRPVPRRLS